MLALFVCVGGGRDVDWIARGFDGAVEYLVLVWNLFLAWMHCCWRWESAGNTGRSARGGWKLYSLAALWLLFFRTRRIYSTD